MADRAGSAVQAVENAAIDGLGRRDAVDGALREARNTGFPGLAGGPADAYRHLIITGEIVRRFGPVAGPPLTAMHDALNRVTGQTQVDTRNNSVAADAPEHQTWEDVVASARGKIIEAAAHDGDGKDRRAFWYAKQPPGWRPDFTEVPITPIEKGGPEHRYNADEEAAAGETQPAPSPKIDPLDRPAASWSDEDIREVLNSPAYLEARHPRHEQVQRDVRAWFECRFGTGPVPADATGRAIQVAPDTAARAAACPVAVRAHSRDGGKVRVEAHCRSMPAA